MIRKDATGTASDEYHASLIGILLILPSLLILIWALGIGPTSAELNEKIRQMRDATHAAH